MTDRHDIPTREQTEHEQTAETSTAESPARVRIYGVAGCGPCEVAKLFLQQQRVDHTFVDVSEHPDQRRALRDRLGEPTAGVVLEDDGHLETMLGVSIPRLHQWLAGYRDRHGDAHR
ncbi:MAG: glutaredoxin [Trueperaceae bacterium]|nr:glutaredoxin [Trueperaceae bacterium]